MQNHSCVLSWAHRASENQSNPGVGRGLYSLYLVEEPLRDSYEKNLYFI